MWSESRGSPTWMQQDVLDHLKNTIHKAPANKILGEFSSSSCSSSEPGCPSDSFWLDDGNCVVNLILHGLDQARQIKPIKNWGKEGKYHELFDG